LAEQSQKPTNTTRPITGPLWNIPALWSWNVYIFENQTFHMEIIKRGAEAVLYLSEHHGRKALIKERIKKGYRLKVLDERIRSRRTKMEERLLGRAKRFGVRTPNIFAREDFKIIMEFVDGERLKDFLGSYTEDKRFHVYRLMGEAVAKLHSTGIIHGDLTTSNMILENDRLCIIDFGLGKFSSRIEDQAVDLYLLYEALCAAHFRDLENAWKNILKVYKQKYSKSKEVLNRFEKIRTRRRYRGRDVRRKE